LEEAAMEANKCLVHDSLSLAFQSNAGWRGAIAAVMARLMKAWVGLYAPPPRRALPPL
jgi:hypothetical protein